MTKEQIEGAEHSEPQTNTPITSVTKQAQDTVEWIMKWGAESANDSARMVEKLERLESSLEAAIELYKARYAGTVTFEPLRETIETIVSYDMTDGLNPEIVDLQGLFSKINEDISDEDIALFRNLQMEVMKKSPETQSHMLQFFYLVSNHTGKNINELSINKNPLKRILFIENSASYKEWIVGIFENFEKDEATMTALEEAILSADAPKISSKPFMRDFYENRFDLLEEEDAVWLKALYEQYPDEKASDVPGTIPKKDVDKRNTIALKYILKYSEEGKATPEAIEAAKKLRDSLKK